MNALFQYEAGDVYLPLANPPIFFRYRHAEISDCYDNVLDPITTGNYESLLSILQSSHHHHSCRYHCFDNELLKQSNESFFLKIIEMSPGFLIKYGTHLITGKSYFIKHHSLDSHNASVINRINELYRIFEYNNYKRRSVAIIALNNVCV